MSDSTKCTALLSSVEKIKLLSIFPGMFPLSLPCEDSFSRVCRQEPAQGGQKKANSDFETQSYVNIALFSS